MGNKPYKLISIFLLIALISVSLLIPAEAQAKISLKKFGRWMKKRINFVVNLPKKATRWMGPVLGPIAADVLSANLTKHHKLGKLFKRLRKADKVIRNIDEQKKILGEVQQMYKDQAGQIHDQITKLKEARWQLKQDLTKTDMTYSEFEEKVLAIDNTIQTYEKAAGKFNQAADRITVKDVLRMVGQDILKEAMGQIRNAVIYEASAELEKLIDPSVISTLVDQGNLGADSLIDLLVSGDVARVLDEGEYSENFDADALLERVRERIKETLKKNKDALKDNFKAKVDEIIKDMIAEVEKAKDEYSEGDKAKDSQEGMTKEEADKAFDELLDFEEDAKETKSTITTDEHGCKPGYVWRPQSGVGCVQENCSAVGDAHWSYEGYCVCGSSGSMFENPEDPNKECSYKADYASCPSCVYACVGLQEECSEPPK